ncbi:hypothetical protein F5Y07DRAFT_394448 [Xylaria sp. FL0933]|nr:hypothetical protein F5Y07DRAFT_394448 [Xylaria sp. FL0933]
MPPNLDHKGVIVVGIDFGTTFTGVAYAYVRPGSQGQGNIAPVPITLWPASSPHKTSSDTPKVPSSVSYTQKRTIAWGHQANNTEAGIFWSKLLLLDESNLQPHLMHSEHLKQARERIEKTGKNVVTVTSEFFEKIWGHALETITRAFGRQFVNTRPFHVVITIPAIWQDAEIQLMEDACKKAGVFNKRSGCADTTHAFISEPEAAALTAIDEFNKRDVLKAGRAFVVADLGGGTVDLISFRAKSVQPELVLEEVVEGEGALCGATFLDQAFLKCIEKKIRQRKSKDKNLRSWQQLHELERERIVDIEWEKYLKRDYYDGHSDHVIDLGAQGSRRPQVRLSRDDLNRIFDSVYDDISALVESQVSSVLNKTGDMPQFIVLTGGFGRCEYVYRKLYQQYENQIEILFDSSDRPWTAVARGAVYSGLDQITNQGRVHSRVSRFSYGWTKWEDFNHGIHDLEDHEIHELTGRPVAREQMEWIILRGESVNAQSSRVYEYERYFDIDTVGFVHFSEPIYRSSSANPSKRLAENETGEPCEFQRHAIIDMRSPVPVEELPRRGGQEFPYRILYYQVEVNISGSSLVIKATSQGEEIGEKRIPGISDQADESSFTH